MQRSLYISGLQSSNGDLGDERILEYFPSLRLAAYAATPRRNVTGITSYLLVHRTEKQ
jgi:hypothetical protein